MSWFCKPETVKYCRQCEHAFRPRINDNFPDYCSPCAKPMAERQYKIDRVLEWARANWEKLEPQAAEYFAAQMAAYAKGHAAAMADAQNQYSQHVHSLSGQGSVGRWP